MDAIRTADPYEAVLAYRDLVRLEAPLVRDRLGSSPARKKYDSYLRTYERPRPARDYTDHNYAEKLRPMVELVRARRGAVVLDPACGNGFEAFLFALQGAQVHASDCAPERHAIAKVRQEVYRDVFGADPQVTISLGSALKVDVETRFDLVFVQEAISHIHPAEQFLTIARECYLRDTGRLVVCDSNSWNPVTRLRITRHLWAERRTLRHFVTEIVDPVTGEKMLIAEERLFSPVTMRRMMRKAGLIPESTWMSGFTPPALVRKPASRLARRIDSVGRSLPLFSSIGGFYTITARCR